MTSSFVHLRVHSEFSLIDGLVRIKKLIGQAKSMGMPAVALTDQSNFCALVKFFKESVGAGVKPIIGADLWIENPEEEDKPYRMTALCMNEIGYKHLTVIISRSFQLNQHFGKAIVKRGWIEELNEGIIFLSGARQGDIGAALLAGNQEVARKHLQEWMAIFPQRFYLEIQRTGRAGEELYLREAINLAEELNCPVVATNDVCFIDEEEFEPHEARVCIHDGVTLGDPRREKRYSKQQYFRSSEEMVELFEDIPEAIENTIEIAKRCSVEVKLGKYYLPNYPIPDGETLDSFFCRISAEGLNDRLVHILDKNASDYEEKRKIYDDRLKFELDIINQMGFPGYFLIVMDFIQWAKDHGIPVGPGRGSGAGSLVAYALLITDLDPIQYDLLFERFLNPERVSMPDFDIDFCMDNRDKVIAYVADNYGRDAVSQIITFGTMAAKAVVRDVARVQGKSYSLGDKLSKLIPFEPGMTLKKAFEQEPAIQEFIDNDDEAAEVMEMARVLEGVTRNVGKHAGGVVIAPTKLTDFSALYCDEHGDGLVTQFDKNDVEEAGLVKFDFLGLRTLTIIDWAIKTIDRLNKATGQEPLDITKIPLDDRATFDLLQSAETTAVFQLESRGMKDLIKRLQPSCFEDIIALVALFRPGPLQSGMVDDFINRKHGRQAVEYPRPELEPVLSNTYGVILYQEQVMQIAQVLALYSLGQADMLRRAMGKKKPEEMAKQRVIFNEGCSKNNIPEDTAIYIFDLMEKFAGYGFNKSHSAAYALVSYQTAWLKTHFPAPFMAAVLTSDMQNTDKVVIFIEECRSMKLEVRLPSVNEGEFGFTVNDEGEIIYGLGAIKGLGEGPIEAIIAARSDGKGAFKNLFDFCERIDTKKINKRAMEALIQSGCLDIIGPNRAILEAALEEALLAADQKAKNANAGMVDLFGGLAPSDDEGTDNPYEAYLHIHEWPDRERLQKEKDTLGLFLSGHPFDEYQKEMRRLAPTPIVQLKPSKGIQKISGLVVDLRVMRNKKGDKMGFVTLDDRTARIEIAFFSEPFEQFQSVLQKDQILVVEGDVSFDDYSGKMKVRAKSAYDVVSVRKAYAKRVLIRVKQNYFSKGFDQSFQHFLQGGEDGCQVEIEYHRSDAKARVKLGDMWRMEPSDELIQNLKNRFGSNNVKLSYD